MYKLITFLNKMITPIKIINEPNPISTVSFSLKNKAP